MNQSKNEIGRKSMHILDKLNAELVGKLSINEWKTR